MCEEISELKVEAAKKKRMEFEYVMIQQRQIVRRFETVTVVSAILDYHEALAEDL